MRVTQYSSITLVFGMVLFFNSLIFCGPNEDAGIVFDLATGVGQSGNDGVTSIPSQPVGTHIRVDVYCTGVHNLDTYEFEVIYDPAELDYITATPTNPITFEGNILESNSGTAVGWMIDTSTPGVLSIAYTLVGTDTLEAPEGEGLIADIVFQALVNTYGTLTFGNVYFYDSFGVMDIITDTGTATLPVELTAFTATYIAEYNYISICWTTASETDMIGFDIYRSEYDDITTAGEPINAFLISGHGTTSETNEYSFIDETADPYYTTYYYWLEVINFGGTNDVFGSFKYIPIDINNNGELDIIKSVLDACYPNPAILANSIKFSFTVGGLEGTYRNVELKIYNILGELVDVIIDDKMLVNKYDNDNIIEWTPKNLPNGIYFYQLKSENFNEVKKLIIVNK